MPDLITLANKQKKELTKADEANLEAISRAYQVVYGRLKGDVDALVLAIEDMDNPTAAEVKRTAQYKRLIKDAETELNKFGVYLNTAIESAALAAIGLGLAHSSGLITALTGAKTAGLDTGAMKMLLKYLADGSPLYKRLDMITTATIESVVESIVKGVSQGFNPRKIAEAIQDSFGGGLTDALRNMRTVQIKSYQDSTRANYMASGVVEKWIWFAELDDTVCLSCAAMHGTTHDLDETLDDHYNGRCVALPYIEGLTEPIESGKTWFDNLPEAQQAAMMGQGKYEAYQAGKFEFEKLSKQNDNEIFGTMRTETPLKDLVKDEE